MGGYVLPFGQMSFWGATVITNLLSPFPSLIEWVCGGHYIYNPTLKRFFLFHFQFPFLLCGFRILHLYYLHFLSSTNPLRNSCFCLFLLSFSISLSSLSNSPLVPLFLILLIIVCCIALIPLRISGFYFSKLFLQESIINFSNKKEKTKI